MAKILVVDDEKTIVKGLRFSLLQDSYEVDTAYNGEDAVRLAEEQTYDMILLDIMLPKMNGFEVCQQIRSFSDVPIIMLTAKDEDMEKILGLEYGADDYITKPFNILEVKARIKAILRRRKKKEEDKQELRAGDLRLDIAGRRVYKREREINITSREFDLLELLATNPGKIYSRDDLLQILWGSEGSGDSRTVDVHVRRLREKIEDMPSDPKYVMTKWGTGYYFHG